MKPPKFTYQAAVSIFFVLAAVVVALAGMLPSKHSVAAGEQAEKPVVTASPSKSRQGSTLKQEEWARLLK